MRKAIVTYKDEEAGILSQLANGFYEFQYLEEWVNTSSKPAISLTLPKQKEIFRSEIMFAFFYHLLPEGANKEKICYEKKIDESDHFGLLISTAQYDTIGAVKLKRIK